MTDTFPEARRWVADYIKATGGAKDYIALQLANAAPGLLAKVDELTAERDAARDTANVRKGQLQKAREHVDDLTAALTEARKQAATSANEVGRLVAEMAELRRERDEAREHLNLDRQAVATLRQQRDAYTAVVEAAKAWAASEGIAENALLDALEALPKAEPDPRRHATDGCDDCSVEPGERHRYAECPGNLRVIERAKAEATR